MLVLWDEKCITQKDLCQLLYLDSGTMTPVLKSLEGKGLIEKFRSKEDERVTIIKITDKGVALKTKAKTLPDKMSCYVGLSECEAKELYRLSYKMLSSFNRETDIR